MKWDKASALLFAAGAAATPQGVTENISPAGVNPAGCQPSYSGQFRISVNVENAKRAIEV